MYLIHFPLDPIFLVTLECFHVDRVFVHCQNLRCPPALVCYNRKTSPGDNTSICVSLTMEDQTSTVPVGHCSMQKPLSCWHHCNSQPRTNAMIRVRIVHVTERVSRHCAPVQMLIELALTWQDEQLGLYYLKELRCVLIDISRMIGVLEACGPWYVIMPRVSIMKICQIRNENIHRRISIATITKSSNNANKHHDL